MVNFNFGGIGSMGMSLMGTWFFWLILLIAIFFVTIGSMVLRKKGKLKYPTIIFSSKGNGKVNLIFTRSGWFKSNKFFGGLLDVSGERRLEVKDGRIVQQGSNSDFNEIEYKSALLLQEKEDDPRILIPINKCELSPESKKMIMKIAPADYRDACSKIVSDAEKESMSKWETMAQIVVYGLLAVVLFISIILTIQYSKNTLAEANNIHKEALDFYDKVLDRMNVAPSTNAP